MRIRTTEKCSHDGCDGKYYAKGYCYRHYQRMLKGRKIDAPFPVKENEVEIKGNIAHVYIYNIQNYKIGYFVIDTDKVREIEGQKWWKSSNGYICANDRNSGDIILLHRHLTRCPKDMVVDHINHNKSDNRMSNLRICTFGENVLNQKELHGKTNTGEFGICRNKKGYYIVQLDNKYRGCSTNLKDAIKIRDAAVEKSRYKELGII